MKDLKKSYDICISNMLEAVQSFPLENKVAYAMWLRDIYEYAEHSTRILATAGANMPIKHNHLSNRFIIHASEERGHEKLVERDLKTLGYNVADMQATNETKFFYQSLYYWLSKHSNPLGIMGWVLALEGIAVSVAPWAFAKVKEAHSGKAGNFLRVHGEEDPGHLDEAFKMINKLEGEDLKIVIDSLEQYSNQYVNILSAIKTYVAHRNQYFVA